jgi:hypothetical protein
MQGLSGLLGRACTGFPGGPEPDVPVPLPSVPDSAQTRQQTRAAPIVYTSSCMFYRSHPCDLQANTAVSIRRHSMASRSP